MVNLEHIKTLIKAGRVPMMEGAPGSGKTSVLKGLADEMGMDFLPIIMSVMEPIDPMGMPSIDTKAHRAEFVPFGNFQKVYSAKKPLLVLLDDLGQASAMVQSAIMQVIEARELNEHKVPDCVRFCIATNRPRDRAGVSQVISPIRGRVVTLPWTLTCDCSPRKTCQWHTWAQSADIHPSVYAYVSFRPDCLADYDKDNVDYHATVCSPRALEYLSDCETIGIHDPAIDLITGILGQSRGTEYNAFRTMAKSLPIYQDIVQRPDTALVPNESSGDGAGQMCAISAMLSLQTQPADVDPVIQYLSRLPVEIGTATIMGMMRRIPTLTDCAAFVNWATKYAGDLLV